MALTGQWKCRFWACTLEVFTVVLGNRPCLCLPCDAHHNPA